ncbi:MAG: carboxypeptidase M32 [Solirubrobacterales bacterium]|nr:carboxypeptidase M32 [Solirubrobacterales bacterium]
MRQLIEAPPELAALRGRLQEIADLQGIVQLLRWDQATMMPPAGAATRAERSATLDRALHEKLVSPELGRLLEGLEPWAAGEHPDSDDARLVWWARRDHEKAARVPADLSADLSRAAALGQAAWLDARDHADFGRFSDALERHLELRHRYVGCFEGVEHPYDVLLDDFEPGMRTSEVVALLADLRAGLAPLVSATAQDDRPRNDGVFDGPFGVPAQRAAIEGVLAGIGFDPGAWRLDPAPHPFASGVGRGDTRITLRYDEHDFGMAFYSALHEFGHGLYAAGTDPGLDRTTLDRPVSLGVHESQSRLWENLVGRSRPFCDWLLPKLRLTLGSRLGSLDASGLFRAVNAVSRSLIRVEADETTYNLHIVMRFELELALLEGELAVAELPDAWNARMVSLFGVEVPDDGAGVLQDTHWGIGAIGYFATYTLGNLMAAQLWPKVRSDLPDLDESIAAGDFAPLRGWLGEHIHRHGRKFALRELLAKVTGEELSPEPFLRYLRAKLVESGQL